jgi:hypothetical protein
MKKFPDNDKTENWKLQVTIKVNLFLCIYIILWDNVSNVLDRSLLFYFEHKWLEKGIIKLSKRQILPCFLQQDKGRLNPKVDKHTNKEITRYLSIIFNKNMYYISSDMIPDYFFRLLSFIFEAVKIYKN